VKSAKGENTKAAKSGKDVKSVKSRPCPDSVVLNDSNSYEKVSSYKAGIVKAILDLKDRTGSSLSAIKKNMQASLPSTKKWGNTTFLTALKSSVIAGDLLQVKGSYKLSPEFKKKIADAAKP